MLVNLLFDDTKKGTLNNAAVLWHEGRSSFAWIRELPLWANGGTGGFHGSVDRGSQ